MALALLGTPVFATETYPPGFLSTIIIDGFTPGIWREMNCEHQSKGYRQRDARTALNITLAYNDAGPQLTTELGWRHSRELVFTATYSNAERHTWIEKFSTPHGLYGFTEFFQSKLTAPDAEEGLVILNCWFGRIVR